MIDCNATFDYLHEFNRRCDSLKKDGCRGCGFRKRNKCEYDSFKREFPELCTRIIQMWSDANPEKTLLTVFNSYYPSAVKGENGIPHICVAMLGIVNYCNKTFDVNSDRCKRCWNTPVE